MRLPALLCSLALLVSCLSAAADDSAEAFKPDNTVGAKPPEGAIVLFDGTDAKFVSMKGEEINWPIEDGALVSTPAGNRNHICSKWHFRDADIHVEFLVPEKGPGNSGVYIHGNYELQILKSDEIKDEDLTQDHCGAVYGFAKPLTNAALPSGEWQVYDIRYRAPRRDDSGKIIEEGSITAYLNGELVQENTRFGEPKSVFHPFRFGNTPYLDKINAEKKKTAVGPVFLQDHHNPVKFKNVWIKPLDDQAKEYKPE